MTSSHGQLICHLDVKECNTSVLTRSDDFATMTTMIGGPTVSSTIPAAVPMYKPPPVTHAPQGQPVTPSPQGQQMTPAPLQG